MPDWATVYTPENYTQLPWFHPTLDPNLTAAATSWIITPGDALLDIGTGTGNQAAALQQAGFNVTGLDLSAQAVALAQAQYPHVHFLHADFLTCDETLLDGPFAVIVDRGCFHVFNNEARQRYVQRVAQLLAPNGQLWLTCFSHLQPGNTGPYRYSPQQLTAAFAPQLTPISIQHTVLYGQLDPMPKALFARFSKLPVC
jgi:cyclopropane fatty-acyl-phospholipid synthase-like methyltransferase